MSVQRRLRAYLFVVHRRDGSTSDAIFYAADQRTATRYAREWAQRVGHRRVELVLDEEVRAA